MNNKTIIELDNKFHEQIQKYDFIGVDLKKIKLKFSQGHNNATKIAYIKLFIQRLQELGLTNKVEQLCIAKHSISYEDPKMCMLPLPKEVFELENLTKLNLADNVFSYIPEGIHRLSRLKVLNLNNTRLKSLPNDLCKLESLEVLEASTIGLEELPTKIGSLKSLKVLCVMNLNTIQVLPTSMKRLNNLEKLYICNGHLCQIPSWIGKLGKLRHLVITNNCIRAIPLSIANLAELKVLSLYRNPLTYVVNSEKIDCLEYINAKLIHSNFMPVIAQDGENITKQYSQTIKRGKFLLNCNEKQKQDLFSNINSLKTEQYSAEITEISETTFGKRPRLYS